MVFHPPKWMGTVRVRTAPPKSGGGAGTGLATPRQGHRLGVQRLIAKRADQARGQYLAGAGDGEGDRGGPCGGGAGRIALVAVQVGHQDALPGRRRGRWSRARPRGGRCRRVRAHCQRAWRRRGLTLLRLVRINRLLALGLMRLGRRILVSLRSGRRWGWQHERRFGLVLFRRLRELHFCGLPGRREVGLERFRELRPLGRRRIRRRRLRRCDRGCGAAPAERRRGARGRS